jgi:hypothetical protein
MVPDDDAPPFVVQMAKKLCHDCPVKVECLALAEQVTELHGIDQAQGVWGGLTAPERGIRVALGLESRPCRICGLDYVPISLKVDKCSSCAPRARRHYDDYRPQIVPLIADGLSVAEVAARLRIPKDSIPPLLRRWELTSRRSRSGNRELKPCGTLAAKYRHHRKEKFSWRNCAACRLVPWGKGKSKVTPTDEPADH